MQTLMELDQADQDRYEAILGEARGELAGLPEALEALCVPAFDQFAGGEFSRIAALLPAWLGELLPTAPEILRRLGVAGLFGWWYSQLHDNQIDGEATPADALLAQTALLRSLEAYRDLGLDQSPAWADLRQRLTIAAAAHARELATRFAGLEALRHDQLFAWGLDLLVERVDPFFFGTTAQARLAGRSPHTPPASDLLAVLRRLLTARQISDDVTDWIEDLQHGRLTYAAAHLIRSFLRDHAHEGLVTLEFERLVGYQVFAEACWSDLERTHRELCQEALERLRPYGSCRLNELVADQQRRGNHLFSSLHNLRVTIRGFFGA